VNEIALEFQNISVSYGSNPVLQDFSLSIRQGEFVVLLGKSGCGKTTALKTLAGLLPVLRGEIWLNGKNITQLPAEKREMAMVFQKPLLFPFLNVAENIGFGLKMRRKSSREITAKVTDALRLVQLEGFEKRYPRQLSGGQEQRVALARALVTSPQVLLLDEPFSALDAQLRVEMRTLVRNLQKTLGITALFVTHDQDEAISVADRIAFVHQGKVLQYDKPEAFFSAPKTAEAARFFGWIILNGKITENCLKTEHGSFSLLIPAPQTDADKVFSIAFHPSSIQFQPPDSLTNHNRLPAILESRLLFGFHLRYRLRLKSGETLEGQTNLPETISLIISLPLESLLSIYLPEDCIILFTSPT
jgi:putative spermidine/putrescine transport system ATP-binding protein